MDTNKNKDEPEGKDGGRESKPKVKRRKNDTKEESVYNDVDKKSKMDPPKEGSKEEVYAREKLTPSKEEIKEESIHTDVTNRSKMMSLMDIVKEEAVPNEEGGKSKMNPPSVQMPPDDDVKDSPKLGSKTKRSKPGDKAKNSKPKSSNRKREHRKPRSDGPKEPKPKAISKSKPKNVKKPMPTVKRVRNPFRRVGKTCDVYVTRNTALSYQVKKCQELLMTKYETIRMRATGNGISRVLEVAIELSHLMDKIIKVDVKTGTVLAKEVRSADMKPSVLDERCVSACYIRVSRV